MTETKTMEEIIASYVTKDKAELLKIIGWEKFNEALGGGLSQGSLNLVCARSGFGKTNYLVDTAYNLAKQGRKILFVSAELSEDKIVERFIARAGDVDYNKVRKLAEKGSEAIGEAMNNLCANFDIRFFFGQKIEEIYIQASFEAEDKGYDIVIIDHIHELTTNEKVRDELAKTDIIVAKLEKLWKEQNIMIIAAAQFVKGKEKGEDFGSKDIDDIRSASQLRNKATNIIYLYETKEQADKNDGLIKIFKPQDCCANIKLLKARDGWTGFTTSVFYHKARCKFTL